MKDPEESESNEPHPNEPSFENVDPEENMDPEEFESNESHLNEPSFEKVDPEENMDPEEFESKELHLSKPSSENPFKKIRCLPNINKLIFPENPNIYNFKYEDLKFKGRLGNSQYAVKSYKHEPTNKDIAVKIIPIPFDEYRDPCKEYEITSLLREIEVHQKLVTSSNIVKLYGICVHDGDLLICMEPMDKSLEEWYPEIHVEHQCFPEWILGYVTVSVLNSLLDLKEHQIIHRDIKPANILVNKNREIKLCDFGTSRITENNLATTSNVGTYLYWPPERLNYQIEAYDDRSDIWSLGITIAEMILGKRPYHLQENFGKPILLQHPILNTSVDDILNECFKKGDLRNYILAPGFLSKCLEEYMNRPGCKNLIETRFYKEHIKITKEMVANSINKKSRVNKNNSQRKDQSVEKRQRSQSFVIFMKTDEHGHLLQKTIYWPPERFNHQIETYDERSDIWSLGITITEMILGKRPSHLQNFDTFILLQHRILNTSVDDILNECFKKGDLRNYISAPECLSKCLKEYMHRPGCKNLIETRFYKEHIKITKEMVASSINKKSRVNKNNSQRKDQFVEKRQRSQSFVIFMKTDEHGHLLQKIKSSKRRSSSIAHTGVIKGSENGFNVDNNSENISIGPKNMKNDKDHISDASHAYTDLYKCNNGKRKIDMLVFQESI